MGLLHLHNHVSQSLIINLFVCVLLVLFLWKMLTSIDFGTKNGFGRIDLTEKYSEFLLEFLELTL